MSKILSFTAVLVVLTAAQQAGAATIDSNDIPGGGPSSFTTTDGLVTLTPSLGGAPSTIGGGGSGCCFGVGNDQLNDSDGDPATTGDQEALAISLAANTRLDSLSFIFTRATGDDPGDLDEGIRISGFLSDPLVSYYSEDNPVGSLNNVPEVENVFYSAGTLVLSHAWRGGAITVFEFGNPSSTLGQTLTLTVADRDESNPQANFRTIAYTQIPEPSSVLLLGLAGCVASLSRLGRRR